MSIFTKADIEIGNISWIQPKSAYVSTKLYEYINGWNLKVFMLVDVQPRFTTVLQESSYYGDKIYKHEYMIRLVKQNMK